MQGLGTYAGVYARYRTRNSFKKNRGYFRYFEKNGGHFRYLQNVRGVLQVL
jgi:hypothetical protein